MTNAWDRIDWNALDRLRAAFLEGTAGQADYWQSEADLRSYDHTYAQRIGWKWDHVLRELSRRGWEPPRGAVLDWGCGSGIAHRSFYATFPAAAGSALRLWDRSPRAVDYAAAVASKRFAGITVGRGQEGPLDVLLLSHVLTELDDAAMDGLLGLARTAQSVIWVEPGTHEASRRLGRAREALLDTFHPIAPCVHMQACPVLAEGNEAHWCHHFAEPPPGVFTDAGWSRFSIITGIDLRSLPLSYLVLDRRPFPAPPPESVRLIGRPRVYKAHALLLGCAPGGLCECRLSKRNLADAFRRARKDRMTGLQEWTLDGSEITALKEPFGEE